MASSLGRAAAAASVAALTVSTLTTTLAGPTTAAAAPAPLARAHRQLVDVTVHPATYRTVDGVRVDDVPQSVVGGNQRWPDDGKGIWNPVTDRPAARVKKLSKQAGIHMLRYPGGTVANMFDFTRAIGPQAQRGCQTSGGFANGRFASTDSRFGPDEEEKYADAIGGESMVMVSAVSRSAADAADYVEYMNSPADGAATNPNGGTDWAEVRAANGHPKPYGIHYWEFGNEPFLLGQHYWWSPDTATRLQQFIHGGWQHQGAQDAAYQGNDGLFLGCDLATRQKGSGQPGQTYRVRFGPIALPGDPTSGVGDGPVTEPVLKVAGTTWTRVTSLADQGADAQVYTVDQAAGTVSFGDGTHGAVPAAGASLSIDYTSGVHDGFLQFQQAMKAVDPTIDVCSGWGQADFVEAMGATPYDCVGVHAYSTPADDGTLTRYDGLQAAAADRTAELADLRTRMATSFPKQKRRPDLLVTEYGVINVGSPQYEARLGHTLYLASQLAGQLRNDVRVSINSNTADVATGITGSDANLLGSTPFLTTARSLVFRLFASVAGGRVLRTGLAHNPTVGSDTGRYGALDVLSSCTDGTVRTIVVNRDATAKVRTRLTVSRHAIAGPVEVSTVDGASPESFNDPAHLHDVTLTHARTRA
jgi:alpha-L-arabinofuranosidase